jgi:hypothetical protein
VEIGVLSGVVLGSLLAPSSASAAGLTELKLCAGPGTCTPIAQAPLGAPNTSASVGSLAATGACAARQSIPFGDAELTLCGASGGGGGGGFTELLRLSSGNDEVKLEHVSSAFVARSSTFVISVNGQTIELETTCFFDPSNPASEQSVCLY